MSGGAAQLRSVLLLVRDAAKAMRFYTDGLRLPVIQPLSSTTGSAELSGGTMGIMIQQMDGNEAALAQGYSPFLNFDVDDMDQTIYRVMEMGASLDGPIQYPPHGKIATLRSPDGHMIGLYEPAQDS